MNLLRRNTLFRRMLLSDAISIIGDCIYYLALMTYASQLPNSAQAIWWVSLSETLPGVLHLFLGVYADRVKRRTRLLLHTFTLRMICYLAVGVLIGYAPSMAMIAVIALLNFGSDLIGKLASSLAVPLYVQAVKDDELEEANSWRSAIQRIVIVVSQFAGSFLILLFSFRTLAWLNSATFVAGGFLLLTVAKRLMKLEDAIPKKAHDENEVAPRTSYWGDLRQSFRLLYQNKRMFFLVLQVTLINAALFPLNALFSMASAATGAPLIRSFSFTLALFATLGSVGVILGNVVSAKWMKETSLMKIIGWNYAAVLGFCIGLWTGQLYLTLLMYLIACACVGALSPKYGAMFAREVDRRHLASISGVSNTLGNIGGPLSQILIGGAASTLSLPAGAGALSLLVVIGFLYLLKGTFRQANQTTEREAVDKNPSCDGNP
ncbi:MFS transporter [Gorillibacterium sp. CAU 1737]|uniref:MFS transporter n=1 Tax=Gorillibacterium sp. CAU 1737 TaxID=3140362 RepID=UPI00326056EB